MGNCLDHLCIIVKNIDDVRRFFLNRGISVQDIEVNGGTKRLFVNGGKDKGKLLFIEVIGDGIYKSYLARRGYGIHHAGILVDDIREFLHRANHKGWYLHTASIDAYEESKKVWLVRPGFPVLLEIMEGDEKNSQLEITGSFIDEIFLPDNENGRSLIEILDLKEMKTACLSESRIHIGEEYFVVRDFYEELS